MIESLRSKAKELLESGEVTLIVGYAETSKKGRVKPVFIEDAGECDQLTFDANCVNNLALYLTRNFEFRKKGKVAVVAKGCDVKNINVLIQENQFKRDEIVILAVSCDGVTRKNVKADAPLSDDQKAMKCLTCDVKTPSDYDFLYGEEIHSDKLTPMTGGIFDEVDRVRAMPAPEKWLFWKDHFDRCIKCYACKKVCPQCYCDVCITEKSRPQWLETSAHSRGNYAWNVKRAMDLAGRCTFCGECERACPAEIPLDLVNQEMSKKVYESFDGYIAGKSADADAPFVSFKEDDKENFIR